MEHETALAEQNGKGQTPTSLQIKGI